MTLNSQTQNIIQELKAELAELYGSRFQGLYVYGSYARETQRLSSDIDVAYVLDDFDQSWPEIERTGPIVSKLSLELGVTISLVPVRESDLRGKLSLLARSVAREGIAV